MFIPIQSVGSLNVHLINTNHIIDIILSMRGDEKQVAIIKMNNHQPLAIVDAMHFLKLIGKQNG